MQCDGHELRKALGHFATGVTIVTACARDGTRLGVTANSFSSVSLEPPLILVSLARSLLCFEELNGAVAFAVIILDAGQTALSTRFATPNCDKWAGMAPEYAANGCPLVRGRLGHFECRPYARHDGGDHVILVGEVTDFVIMADPDREPLIFFRGRYRRLGGPAAAPPPPQLRTGEPPC